MTTSTAPIEIEQALAEFLLRRERDPDLRPAAFAATLPADLQPCFAVEVEALSACDAWLPLPCAAPAAEVVRLGPFRLLRRLGHGASASVHAVIDERTGAPAEPVALKVRHGTSADERRHCAREAAVLARLDHPAIVGLRQATAVRGRPALVLDLVDGATLRELLHARREPADPRHAFAAALLDSPARVVALVLRLVEALAHAHGRGIVHRDLKPANIVVDRAGAPTIVDFGLARDAAAAGDSVDGEVLGTPLYMAPEQLAGLPAGPGADLWAVGLLLQECLTGEPARGPAGDLRRLPRSLRRIVRRCCAQRPEQRWRSADCLQRALQRWLRLDRWRRAASPSGNLVSLRRLAVAAASCVLPGLALQA